MWQQRAHQYLVNAFLRSPRFHRLVKLLDREGYDEGRFPDIAEMNRLHKMEAEVKRRKASMFWSLFREELGYEFMPWKKRPPTGPTGPAGSSGSTGPSRSAQRGVRVR